jgi:hypothetical protein
LLPQVSHAAWALGKARHHTRHLGSLEQQAARVLCHRLANKSSNAAGGGTVPPSNGRSTARSSQPTVSLKHYGSLVWGIAMLGYQPLYLVDLLPAVLARQPPLTQEQPPAQAGQRHKPPSPALRRLITLSTVAWSLAVADCANEPAVHELAAGLATAAEKLAPGELSRLPPGALLSLHQFALVLQQAADAGGDNAAAAWQTLQHEPAACGLLAAAADAWQQSQQNTSTNSKVVSACQADVTMTARDGLGLTLQQEAVVAGLSGKQQALVGWLPQLGDTRAQ